jgi:hypothetical protein
VINLNQVQDKKYTYDIPIEIGIFQEGNQMPEISSFQLSERENEFIIPLTEQPQSISIDPNTKLLAEWELRRVK